jgi:DNA-binding IclR family transcriptional regulator
VVLASLPPAQLHRLLDSHVDDVVAAGLPRDWPSFRRYYARIRKDGHYVSNGELEPTLLAVAAPLVPADGRVVGAVSVVASVERLAVLDLDKLAQRVERAAREISARIGLG